MEPVTHLLTGACLARSGFHKRFAYATAAMVVAAEFPDIDTLWGLRGPVSGFEHHRGITHTFLGVPFEAGLLLLLFFSWDLWRRRRSGGQPIRRGIGVQLRWGPLYGLIVLALLSHLLLDYTNNYGLRPFFPFNNHWYAASIVFIFDPLLFLFLMTGLVMPSLFRLVGGEIGAKDRSIPGSGWARAALAGVLLLWGIRTYEHGRALDLAARSTLRAPSTASPGETELPSVTADVPGGLAPSGADPMAPAEARPLLQPLQTLASPDPLSIFRWYDATDFGPADQLAVADSRLDTLIPERLLVKPPPSTALTEAEHSRLGKLYLDWSPMPFLSVETGTRDTTGQDTRTIRFQDPRFMADTPILHRGTQPPLTGVVVLGVRGAVLAEGMDGRFGR